LSKAGQQAAASEGGYVRIRHLGSRPVPSNGLNGSESALSPKQNLGPSPVDRILRQRPPAGPPQIEHGSRQTEKILMA
jgi:hypothetical protein